MKVEELSGAALDWAVFSLEREASSWYVNDNGCFMAEEGEISWKYQPSTNWAQGGPLIEKYGITIADHSPGHRFKIKGWVAWRGNRDPDMGWNNQPTPLIAAMQCIVATELGDEVELPEGLLP